ncbi:diacylglycerol kinase [Rhizobium sp. C4]|uniref:diacylglycerol kinase n=1 Tax=Rhizobium sp. C4 TaxID=1349800 RepID=UPI001E595152|nr:diacylglycerol kinase [Rhizobium sp. C4]MCD2171589.1 diacylglycerol kinase [Rhizobium sp. C4]
MHGTGKPPFVKETGFRHFVSAARYSWQGFLRLLQEAAFRQQLGGFVLGIIVLLLVGATFERIFIFAGLMMVLFAFEAVNTAIEELVDHLSPEFSIFGRHAKDLGSLACACLIGLNAAYLAYAVAEVYLR